MPSHPPSSALKEAQLKYQFYVYMWLREDGTPYYVGKGSGRRAYRTHRVGKVPPIGRTVFYVTKDEEEAFELEVILIWYYGRKDNGTGCLRNLTDGGEGVRKQRITEKARTARRNNLLGNKLRLGIKHTPEMIVQMSNAHKGKVFSKEHRAKIGAANIGNKGGHVKNHVNKGKFSAKCKWCIEGSSDAT